MAVAGARSMVSRRRVAAGLVLSAIALPAGRAARAQPAAREADDPLAAAQAALVDLDRLAAVGGAEAARVIETMERGLRAVDVSRKLGEIVPTTAPTTRGGAAAVGVNPAARRRQEEVAEAQRRIAACSLAFVESELRRRAAGALAAADPRRGELIARAMEGYKTLRVEYRDVTVGRLGYAGEARLHRMAGNLPQADAALAAVLVDLNDKRVAQPQQAGVAQVQRALWLERVETALAKNIAEGRALAEKLLQSPLMAEAGNAEKGAVRWAAVRAEARLAAAGAGGDAAGLVGQLRGADVVAAAPEYERVTLLEKVAAKAGAPLSAGEQLALARLYAWAGIPEAATELFAAAAKAGPAEFAPEDWRAYGALMAASGEHAGASAALEKAYAGLAADSPDRRGVLRALAFALVEDANRTGDVATRRRAAEALWELAKRSDRPEQRLEALRAWAYAVDRLGELGRRWTALAPYAEWVDADPYVQFSVARARWAEASGAAAAATRPAPNVGDLAGELGARLERLLPASDADLKPSVVALVGEMKAAAPEGGTREALEFVRKVEPTLKADAPGTPYVAALKLRLLIDLGLTDEAEALAAKLPADVAHRAAGLRLAQAMARRYEQAAGSAQQRAELRQRVVRLATGALARQEGDRGAYRAAAIEACRQMLAVEAYADAQAVLEGMKAAASSSAAPVGGGGGGDAPGEAEASLLLARAMAGQGKAEAAREILDSAAREHPESGSVHLAAGQFRQDLKQWDAAAEAYRAARKYLPAAGAEWWRATVGLAEVLIASSKPQGAAEVLRVANVLYRSSAPADLLPRIDAATAASGGGSRGAGAAQFGSAGANEVRKD